MAKKTPKTRKTTTTRKLRANGPTDDIGDKLTWEGSVPETIDRVNFRYVGLFFYGGQPPQADTIEVPFAAEGGRPSEEVAEALWDAWGNKGHKPSRDGHKLIFSGLAVHVIVDPDGNPHPIAREPHWTQVYPGLFATSS